MNLQPESNVGYAGHFRFICTLDQINRNSHMSTKKKPNESTKMNNEELELLLNYASEFFGYGDLDAPYWFVGAEEAGVTEPSQALDRARVWHGWNPQCPRVVDLQDYVDQLPVPNPLAHGQNTWRPLIRFLLYYAPELRNNGRDQDVTNAEILDFQINRWGRRGDKKTTCLLEMFGLPTASGIWAYANTDRDEVNTREKGTFATFNRRKHNFAAVLNNRLVTGGLKLVFFYARQDYRTALWSEVCHMQSWRICNNLSGDFLWQRRGETLFLCVNHPARGRIRKDQEALFMRELARQARML